MSAQVNLACIGARVLTIAQRKQNLTGQCCMLLKGTFASTHRGTSVAQVFADSI